MDYLHNKVFFMNNNIQEDYCSFEVSKLLKEKEFDIKTGEWQVRGNVNNIFKYEHKHEVKFNPSSYKEVYNCPTHALAIKWIRENFGIWIVIEPNLQNNRCWFQIISKNYKGDGNSDFFNSPEEATEAALLYTLQNLIQ